MGAYEVAGSVQELRHRRAVVGGIARCARCLPALKRHGAPREAEPGRVSHGHAAEDAGVVQPAVLRNELEHFRDQLRTSVHGASDPLYLAANLFHSSDAEHRVRAAKDDDGIPRCLHRQAIDPSSLLERERIDRQLQPRLCEVVKVGPVTMVDERLDLDQQQLRFLVATSWEQEEPVGLEVALRAEHLEAKAWMQDQHRLSELALHAAPHRLTGALPSGQRDIPR
ncbi:MAG: hypothetical protein JJ863_38505 [Deltaproteobacteria bacterium]|nr:hypothetical protein [Deltaproteobacteria bacterium]